MHFGNEEDDLVYERWQADYVKRARVVERQLARVFDEATSKDRPSLIYNTQSFSHSLEFLRKQSEEFPYRVVLFIYSSRFDSNFEKELRQRYVSEFELPDSRTAREIFERKAEMLDRVFKAFALCTDVSTQHYAAALMAADNRPDLPLIWDVPIPDEPKTGIPSDALWRRTFHYLCEMSRMIVAYSGFTGPFATELSYIREQPHLRKRLVCLDQDLKLYFPDHDQKDWPLTDLASVLKIIESQSTEQRTEFQHEHGRQPG